MKIWELIVCKFWLRAYYLEQYPEHGYHSYFDFIRYIPTAVAEAVDELLEVEI